MKEKASVAFGVVADVDDAVCARARRAKEKDRMNLSQLYYFRKLAELEHYRKASEELFITQPSLSNSIGNLEKELGVPLFERVGRNVRLTSYGAEFNEHVCVALSEIDKAIDLMKL